VWHNTISAHSGDRDRLPPRVPALRSQTFFVDDDIQEAYRLDAILTIVDAKHIAQHLEEEKPEGVENESVEQIAFADVIMLNKTDLVSAEQLAAVKAKIKAINAYSAVFETRFSVVPLRDVLGISAFDLTRIVQMDAAFLDVGATPLALQHCGAAARGAVRSRARGARDRRRAQARRKRDERRHQVHRRHAPRDLQVLAQRAAAGEGRRHLPLQGAELRRRLAFVFGLRC
jgi:G3E family GTPase